MYIMYIGYSVYIADIHISYYHYIIIKRTYNMSRGNNIDLMLAAASKDEENKDSIVALEKAAEELREAKIALESTKSELVSAKVELQNVKADLQNTYQKLVDARKALNAAAGSVDNIVGGISNAIVKAEQSTVPVSIKDSDMIKIDGKLKDYLGKVTKITVDATSLQIQEFQKQHRKAHSQYKEWDGIWFGRYSQWIFLPFYFFGFGAVVLLIVQAYVNSR